MGFRSNFITSSYNGISVPDWFSDKYPELSYEKYDGKNVFSVAQLFESKYYQSLKDDERLTDIQKILSDNNIEYNIVLILLHECGGITRVEISKDNIFASEPTGWKIVENVEHDYCYGCSDVRNILDNK